MHVWWFTLDDPGLDALPLTAAERARAARYRDPVDARAFTRARASVRVAVASHADVPPGALRFDRSCARCGDAAHGKPRVVAPAAAAAWRFSASRTRDVAGVAVSADRDVGFDVEALSRVHDADAVVARFFSPAERDAWRARPESERDAAFLSAWTRKEAYLKLRGRGLDAPLARVDTAAWRDGGDYPDPLEPGRVVCVRDVDAPAGTVAALVADGDAPLDVRVAKSPRAE